MNRKLIYVLIITILFSTSFKTSKAQNDFEIAKNVDIFVSILKELNAKYADEISPGDLTKTAIDAMLNSLDPYTVYYPESQIEDFKLMTTGQYGGIGALIQQHEKQIVISELYENSPAQTSGLLAGDVIIKINNQSVVGKNSSDVSTILKGQPGTNLAIEIQRLGEDKTRIINVVRQEIKLPNIPYSGMIDSEIGYIKLDQFTENAGLEVKEAFLKLKEEGMKYLILDLRNNGGGLLHEAVNIMNIFVDKGITIAETKGKIKEQMNTHKTLLPVTDKEIPVAVLVNEYSASASEIVSGAFQDLDRGVIIGKKTFGKGLVQNIVPLSYNTSLKVTVSKYYIPSGRCVQNIDYFSHDSNAVNTKVIPDSLAVAYKTHNGRTVYDKGGIEPDVLTEDSLISDLLITLITNNLVFDFANQYFANHKSIPEANHFVITDDIYEEFIQFLKGKDYSYTLETEEILDLLKETAIDNNTFPSIEKVFNEMKQQIENDKANDLSKYKEQICQYLSSEIAVRYYYQKGRIINTLSFDNDIKEATKLLKDSARYQSILTSKK